MPDHPEPKVRVYLAGAMTGLPELNAPEFDVWAAALREAGYEVLSPPEFPHNAEIDPSMSREEIYRLVIPKDIAILYTCEFIVMIPGWQYSPGAGLESHAAILPRIIIVEAPNPWAAAQQIHAILTAKAIWESDNQEGKPEEPS